MAYITKKTTVNGVKPIGSNLFGTCSTGASTTQKTVTMADFDVLVDGVTIHVYFEHENEATNPTLKVGSTSAQPIVGGWDESGVYSFTYYNGSWYQNDMQSGGGSTYTEIPNAYGTTAEIT